MQDHFFLKEKQMRVISEPTNCETCDNHEKRKQSNVTTKFENKTNKISNWCNNLV